MAQEMLLIQTIQRSTEVREMEAQAKDWRALSEAASREQDPEKLICLVEELNRVLMQRDSLKRRYPSN